jgi:hypothetical protein
MTAGFMSLRVQTTPVIANEVKQSPKPAHNLKRLPRRYAPRNERFLVNFMADMQNAP